MKHWHEAPAVAVMRDKMRSIKAFRCKSVGKRGWKKDKEFFVWREIQRKDKVSDMQNIGRNRKRVLWALSRVLFIRETRKYCHPSVSTRRLVQGVLAYKNPPMLKSLI